MVAADKRHVWHPFTPMGEWCAPEHKPLVLVRGKGAKLWDSEGNQYIDGNSSIWTNIHGHSHPHINRAIKRQLGRVAHTSFLGFTNPIAVELAERLVGLFPPGTLSRVFFTDDGSTGMEVALRIVEQYWQLKGARRTKFVAFRGGYHGDTAGAASLGAASMFQTSPSSWSFPATQVESVASLEAMLPGDAAGVAAVVIEPLVQGAAGIRLWPSGTLAAVQNWCRKAGTLLIADEVLTGFGRTGKMFACEHEAVVPDIMILGKALTAGYVPLAATLLTEELFKPFAEGEDSSVTLFYGHSYAGNAIGCAAATASLEVFKNDNVLETLADKIELLRKELAKIQNLPQVKEVRQCGFIAGIQLQGEPTDSSMARRRAGRVVCEGARALGLLTRPIQDVVVLMPPYCITKQELKRSTKALYKAITCRNINKKPAVFC